MHRNTPRFRMLLSLIALAVGCSSGGGGGSSIVPPPTPPPVGTTITATWTGSNQPTVVAVSSGLAGTWNVVSLTGSKATFTLTPGTTTYQIAYFCTPNLQIVELSTADTVTPTFTCGNTGYQTVTFNYSVTVPGAQSADILVAVPGFTQYSGLIPVAGSYTMTGAPGPTVDVMLLAFDANGQSIGMNILRNQTYTNNQNVMLPTLSAAATQFQTFTVGGAPAGWTTYYYTSYILADGSRFNLSSYPTYPLVPASQAVSGDYYLAAAVARSVGSNLGVGAGVGSTVPPASATLPAPFSYAGPTPAEDPTFSFSYTSSPVLTGTIVYTASISWQTASLAVFATQTAVGANPSLTVPNLAKVSPLFPNLPSGGAQVSWQANVAVLSPLTLSSIPAAGGAQTDAYAYGTFTAP